MVMGKMFRWQVVVFSLVSIGCGEPPAPLLVEGDSVPTLDIIELKKLSGKSIGGLSGIRTIVPLSEERIAVADVSNRVIRILDGNGVEITKHGRRGNGPGEFEELSGLWGLSGDTLVAFDDQLNRTQMGHYRTGFTDVWSNTPVADSTSRANPVGTMRGGVVVQEFAKYFVTHDGSTDIEHTQLQLNLFYAGATVKVISGFRNLEKTVISKSVKGIAVLLPHMLYATTDDEIFSLDTAVGNEIVVHGADGEYKRKITIPIKPRLATEADIRADYEALPKGPHKLFISGSQDGRSLQRQLYRLEVIASGDTMPRAVDLRVDESGRFWIRRFVPDYEEVSQGQQWFVFQGDGKPLGQFRIPNTLLVSRPLNGRIWTWGRDAIGATLIQQWQVEW